MNARSTARRRRTLNIGLQILYVPANSGPTSVPSPAAILAENGGEAQGDGASLLWTNTTAAAATFTPGRAASTSAVLRPSAFSAQPERSREHKGPGQAFGVPKPESLFRTGPATALIAPGMVILLAS